MIEGIDAECLLADRGYDTNKIIDYATMHKMNVVIPPKKNRNEQRPYDQYLYTFMIDSDPENETHDVGECSFASTEE